MEIVLKDVYFRYEKRASFMERLFPFAYRGKNNGVPYTLSGINLKIKTGEFFGILGPNACGKSTLLKLVLGIYRPTSGAIYFDGEDVTNLRPRARDVAQLHQNHQFFPHLTIKENIERILVMRGASKEDACHRTQQALVTTQCEEFTDSRPRVLSGGQHRKCALALTFARGSHVLAFDELTVSLDVPYKQMLCREIKRMISSSATSKMPTVIFVTHDHREAVALCDRIAIMDEEGRIVQVDTPNELVSNPQNSFVENFLGLEGYMP